MTKIVVLFNLKTDADVAAYEAWASSTDIPTVNSLPTVEKFEGFRPQGRLGGGRSPCQDVEITDVPELKALCRGVSSERMQHAAAEFMSFTDNPQFIITASITE